MSFKSDIPREKQNTFEQKEAELIKSYDKWQVVKTYHRILKNGLAKADSWKLTLMPNFRDKEPDPLPYVIVMTIKDPNMLAPINAEIRNGLTNRGYSSLPINIRGRERVR